MMGSQATDTMHQPKTMTEYAADRARSGVRVLPGAPGIFWAGYQPWAMTRIPVFHLAPPSAQEVRRVLRRERAAIASYLLEPDEFHPANAWLYLCTDRAYALEKLSSEMRRNVRLGLKRLTISPLTTDQLLEHGAPAFCETRRRHGLKDGTPEEFRRDLTARSSLPELVYLGAWKEDQLAAYLSILQMGDWAEIAGSSIDALHRHKPNDALVYSALSTCLVERGCRVVSYGLSSIQAESNIAGLHQFKLKVGFEARPVHRAFVFHPLVRPFANRLTLWSVNRALRVWPGDPRLRTARGVLASTRGDRASLVGTDVEG